MSLLSLPEDILLHVITLVGLGNWKDLASMALTSKSLHHLVYHRQTVWRHLLLAHFDDPRLACAFPTARVEYDWRQRVIDRYRILELVGQYQPSEDDPFSAIPRMELPLATELAPLVFATLLDMHNDLPSLDTPSLNSPILEQIITWKEFRTMQTVMTRGFDIDRASSYYAIVPHLRVALWSQRASETGRNHFQAWIDFFGVIRNKPRHENPWGDCQTDWQDIAVPVALSQPLDHHPLCLRSLGTEPDHNYVRGMGIRDLHRPTDLPSEAPWDWADVSGTWYNLRTSPGAATGAKCNRKYGSFTSPMAEKPVRFTIVPTTDYDAVAAAYDSVFSQHTGPAGPTPLAHDITSDHAVLPRANLDPNSVLPPLYFYGYSDDTSTTAPPPQFLSGVAHLTRDDPPEVRWDVVIEFPSTETLLRFQGVQPGGRSSPRGVFGLYKLYERTGAPGMPRLPKPRDPNKMMAIKRGYKIPYFDGVMRLFNPSAELTGST